MGAGFGEGGGGWWWHFEGFGSWLFLAGMVVVARWWKKGFIWCGCGGSRVMTIANDVVRLAA